MSTNTLHTQHTIPAIIQQKTAPRFKRKKWRNTIPGKSFHTPSHRKEQTMLHKSQQHGGVAGDAVEISLKLPNTKRLQ